MASLPGNFIQSNKLNVGDKTRNIAYQHLLWSATQPFLLMLRQCFEISCTFFVACFIVALDPVSLSRERFHLWKGSCHFHLRYGGVSN